MTLCNWNECLDYFLESPRPERSNYLSTRLPRERLEFFAVVLRTDVVYGQYAHHLGELRQYAHQAVVLAVAAAARDRIDLSAVVLVTLEGLIAVCGGTGPIPSGGYPVDVRVHGDTGAELARLRRRPVDRDDPLADVVVGRGLAVV